MKHRASTRNLAGLRRQRPRDAYVVIQEASSSTELYLAVYDTEEQANAFRYRCAPAYRTTTPVRMNADTDWDALDARLDRAELPEDLYWVREELDYPEIAADFVDRLDTDTETRDGRTDPDTPATPSSTADSRAGSLTRF